MLPPVFDEKDVGGAYREHIIHGRKYGLNPPKRTWLSWKSSQCPPSEKSMSGTELVRFFDEYLARWHYTKRDAREKKLWWAMFFTWKDGGWWVE